MRGVEVELDLLAPHPPGPGRPGRRGHHRGRRPGAGSREPAFAERGRTRLRHPGRAGIGRDDLRAKHGGVSHHWSEATADAALGGRGPGAAPLLDRPRCSRRDDRSLPPRSGRLWRAPPRSVVAGPGPAGRQLRDQLGGRRREQHPARRPRFGGRPARRHWGRALARIAPPERRVDVRVREPGRRVAAAAALLRCGDTGHRVRGGHGGGTQPAGGATDGGNGARDLLPRLPVDRLPRRRREDRAPAHRAGGASHRGRRRGTAARLVHRPLRAEHPSAGRGGRRLLVRLGLLRRRPPLLDDRVPALRTW